MGAADPGRRRSGPRRAPATAAACAWRSAAPASPGTTSPPYGGMAPFPPAAPTGTDPLAIAALITGLTGLLCFVPALAGIVLGFVALSRIRSGGRTGKGLALGGIIVGFLAIALWVTLIVVGALTADPDRDASGRVTEPRRIDILDVRVGDCLESFSETDTQQVEVVPCTLPHRAEVVVAFDLPDGDYPGDEEVQAQAESGCTDRVPASMANRGLDLAYYYPEQFTWVLDDREVLCVLTSDQDLTAPLPG